MSAIRRYFRVNPLLAAVLVLATLAMKVVVPAGFMPVASGGTVTVQLCSGTGPMTMEMPAPARSGDSDHKSSKVEVPCAFSGLSAPALSAVDPILLAGAVAFVLALAPHSHVPPVIAVAPRLRPPLRGPPTTA